MSIRKLTCVFIIGLALAVLATPAAAQPRVFAGARQLGMGATGVASTVDGMSVYFNPAGMAYSTSWDVQMPLIGIDAEVGGDALSQLDTIHDAYTSEALREVLGRIEDGTGDFEDLSQALETFVDNLGGLSFSRNGGAVRGATGTAFRWKNWGISVGVFGNGGVDTTIDLENGIALSALGFDAAVGAAPPPGACATGGVEVAFCEDFAMHLVTNTMGSSDRLTLDQAETLVSAANPELLAGSQTAQNVVRRIVQATADGETTLAENQSAVVTTAWLASQAAFTYSRMVLHDKLSLGGSFKLMRGETDRQIARVNDGVQAGEDLFENILDREGSNQTSTEVGLDLGVMYRPTPKWSIGLMASNINTPTFDTPAGGEYELPALGRLGASYRPLKWFNAELNLDVNEVDSSIIRGLGYQYANLGVEFLVGRWFQGWLGSYSNLALDNTRPVYTGGLGFGMGRFTLGLSAAVSSEEIPLGTGTDGSDDFPNGLAAAVSLGWRAKRPGA